MNKVIILCAILIAAFAYAEANRCRPLCRKNEQGPIRCVREGSHCRKMRQCSVDEENCRRRISNRPRITTTSMALCRNIRNPEGSGRCAIRRRPRSTRPRPRCDHIRCPDGNKKLNCYRSRKNNCQLLTSCQAQRVNCLRGRNRLELVHSGSCAGMRAGQKLQKCRLTHRKG